ncbi:hypothetical protein HMPREF1377_00534 [Enterococcus faecium R494]|nr:hypothetical protein HMPREF1377_00534 [Enterococcus faecium R494]EJY30447.1 hypothetical protein HMPREF1353_01645 [Enterococcus faecium 513]
MSNFFVRCLFLKKIKKESYGFLTIFVACIMMVLQRILISAVTIPTYATNPGRFYIYTFLQTSVVIGANLIPLYMGYQYQKIARLKVLHYLSRFAFIFLIATLVCNIFFLRTSWQLEYS